MGKKIDIGKHLINANYAINLWYSSLHKNVLDNKCKDEFYNSLEKFSKDVGIYNQAFIVTNKQNNSVDIIQGDLIDKNIRYKNKLPFTKYPLEVRNVERALIDLMFECKRSSQKLNADDIKNPEFFQNIPPNNSGYVIKNRTEENWIKKEEINFLHCGLGEVIFFVIGWRWLIRYAQIFGLHNEIDTNFDDYHLKRKGISCNSLWENCEFLNNSSEFIWVEKLKEIKDKGNEIYYGYELSYSDILQYWNQNVVEKLDRIDESYDIEIEFKELGITKKENQKALKEYIREIEKETNSNLPIELSSVKILLDLIKVDLINENKSFSVSEYLNQLHLKSRFPVIPYFYQTALGNEFCFFEHLALPICVSDSFEFQNSKNKLRIGVLALYSLYPNYRIPVLERIRTIQLFYSYISRPIIDIGFYGNVYKRDIETESYDSFIETLSHEASKVINALDLRTVKIDALFECESGNFSENKIGSLKLNQDYSIDNFKLIPNQRVFSVALQYLKLWFKGEKRQSRYSSTFFKKIVEDSIDIHLVSQDVFLRSYSINDKSDFILFNKEFENRRIDINRRIKYNDNIYNGEGIFNPEYSKLLFITIINCLNHFNDAKSLEININLMDDYLYHSFKTVYPTKNSNWENETNIKIRNKIENNKGSLYQISKYLQKLDGHLSEFKAVDSEFVVNFHIKMKFIGDEKVDNN